MADNRKLAQGLMMMTPAMRADLAGREQDIQRGKTVELLRRAGKEMYDNPIVNTAIGFTPVLGDVQAAGETMSALERGAPWQETAGYAVGMLPFMPMIGKTVWHGSPHTFDKFDLSKIGTGEGAQAYGHGLYLAEARPTAEEYAVNLANRDMANQGRLNAHANAQRLVNLAGDPKYAADDIRFALESNPEHPQKQLLQDTLQHLESGSYANPLENAGSLYKVDLPDEQIAKMLDWDKPLSEQPKGFAQLVEEVAQHENFDPFEHLSVAQAVGKHPRNPSLQDFNPSAEYLLNDISDIYGINRNAPETSSLLQQRGIPGIQYLDQASRGAGEGTRNYVVFSDEIPQILERNGQPVAQALRNYEAPKQQFYHGSTTQGITELDPNKSFGDLGVSWVTPSEDFAKRYARKEGAVYSVDLNEGKNFDFSNPEHLQALREQAKNVEYYDPLRGFQTLDMRVPEAGSYYSAEDPRLFNLIKDMGYDTVAVTEDGIRNIGVFNPKENARIVK